METNKGNLFKRGKEGNGLGFALFLILLGGIFLFLNLGIIPAMYKPLLISWQMLLIVIGLWILLAKREYAGGVILIAVGLFFIYPKLCSVFPEYFVKFDIDLRTFWPVILIIVGIILIMGWMFPKQTKHRNRAYESENGRQGNPEQASINSGDYIDKNVMFGSSEQIVLSTNFKGGEANVMFGELIVDLRKAKLAEGEHKLELNAMFGSVVLYVPSGWYVDTKTSSFLASFEDKRFQTMEILDSTSRLIVKGSAMFGNGEIRN